jgi:hypothetical protein
VELLETGKCIRLDWYLVVHIRISLLWIMLPSLIDFLTRTGNTSAITSGGLRKTKYLSMPYTDLTVKLVVLAILWFYIQFSHSLKPPVIRSGSPKLALSSQGPPSHPRTQLLGPLG